MKTFLFALMAGCIPALVATNGTYAQNSANTEILQPQSNVYAVQKSISPAKANSADMSAINSKALKNFTKTYKNVTGESWEKIMDGFTVKFNVSGVSSRVYYSPHGNWTGSVKGYDEEKMPPEIRKLVKHDFYDYAITYVQEVETIESHGTPTYIVHLEDANNIKQLRVYNGELEVWREFKKQ